MNDTHSGFFILDVSRGIFTLYFSHCGKCNQILSTFQSLWLLSISILEYFCKHACGAHTIIHLCYTPRERYAEGKVHLSECWWCVWFVWWNLVMVMIKVWTNISYSQGGGTNIFHIGGQTFFASRGGQTFLHWGGDKHFYFYINDCYGYDDGWKWVKRTLLWAEWASSPQDLEFLGASRALKFYHYISCHN